MESSQQEKRDLKIAEKARELILVCKCAIIEFNKATTTEGVRRRLRRKILEELNEVTKIKRELQKLQNAPLGLP
jgi:hypothetical protein